MPELQKTENQVLPISDEARKACFERPFDIVDLDKSAENRTRTKLAQILTWMGSCGIDELEHGQKIILDRLKMYKADQNQGLRLVLISEDDFKAIVEDTKGLSVMSRPKSFANWSELGILVEPFAKLGVIRSVLNLYHEVKHIEWYDLHHELKRNDSEEKTASDNYWTDGGGHDMCSHSHTSRRAGATLSGTLHALDRLAFSPPCAAGIC